MRPAQTKSVSALDVAAAGLAGAHGRLDFGLFFAVSKEAVFPRISISPKSTLVRRFIRIRRSGSERPWEPWPKNRGMTLSISRRML